MNEREKILESVYKIAFKNEKEHGNCAQSTMSAFDEIFEMIDENVFKTGHGLAGGTALKTEGTCGALSGGIMVLGALLGRNKKKYFDDESGGIEQYEPYKKLVERFIEEFGSCRCKDVQKELFGRSFDFWNQKDSQMFGELEAEQNNCSEVVGKTSIWTMKIIMEEIDRDNLEKAVLNDKIM